MSLDGVIEPIEAWDFDYIDDELCDLVTKQLIAADPRAQQRVTV
jgi:hypothetical protein